MLEVVAGDGSLDERALAVGRLEERAEVDRDHPLGAGVVEQGERGVGGGGEPASVAWGRGGAAGGRARLTCPIIRAVAGKLGARGFASAPAVAFDKAACRTRRRS